MLDYLLPFSDAPSVCNYLPNQIARLPMMLPARAVTGEQFDELMEHGYRRSGFMFYHTLCPHCRACEALRIDVNQFRPSRTQRRTLAKAHSLRFQLAPPIVDPLRVQLFNRHRSQRGLEHSEGGLSQDDYQAFLLGAPNVSMELSVWMDERLVAVSITDCGKNCLSAVYCFFEPDFSRWSPGTLCILKQIELAQRNRHRWLYLGFYVQANPHLSYKANFRPHQRRIDGRWINFDM
jgi:leucyl-tRNA---protein transferase